MLRNDAALLQIDVRQHHAIAGDQPALEHVRDALLLHRVPAIECGFAFRGHRLVILGVAQGLVPRSKTIRPPTIVYMIRAPRIVSGGIAVRSRSTITTSASIPGARAPFSFSSNDANAPPVV